MTSEPDDLTPAQTDAVRRALRAARHDAPLPQEVAARLDATLAGLVADRASAGGSAPQAPDAPVAPIVPLRRRRWPAILAAAAAVTAIGLAGTQLIDRGSDSTLGASTADRSEQSPSVASAPDVPAGTMSALGSASLGLTPAQLARLADAGYTDVDPVGAPASAWCATCHSTQDSAKKLDSGAQLDQERSTQDQYTAASPAACQVTLPPSLADAPAHLAMHAGRRVLLVVLPDPEGTVARIWPCSGGPATTIRLD